MTLDIEEEFDPSLLGLASPPVRPSLAQPGSGHRFSSGRYKSADWEPKGQEAEAIEGEVIDTTEDEVDDSTKEVVIEAKQEDKAGSEIDLADLIERPPTPPPTPQQPKGRRVIYRMARSRRYRPGVLVYRKALPPPSPIEEISAASQAREVPPHLVDVAAAFGVDIVDLIEKETKANALTGSALPPTVADLSPLLDDLPAAVGLSNALRSHLELPHIRLAKSNRIPLLRQVAKAREQLYMNIVTALLLPNAPEAKEEEIKEDMEKPIYLTEGNLELVGKKLPKVFPKDKAAIKAFMLHPYGEEAGQVRWQDGIGRVIGAEGGYRGKWADGDTHVFVDHSNVLYGLLSTLYPSSSTSLPPRHLRTLSLPVLSLLLRRGRNTPPGTLHLVASSPLVQNLDPMVRLGFEVSVLKRVEILADEVQDPKAMKLTPKMMARLPSGDGAANGLKRFKEQGVDEILHLKILQKLNTREEPGTIVLATGDARGGQFNKDGFVGAVKEALKRGWRVELWSWADGLSRAWRDVARRERWGGDEFSIHLFDEWAEQLVEVLHGT